MSPGTPPPPPIYGAPPAPKRPGTSVWVIVLVCVLVGMCVVTGVIAAILFPVFAQAKEAAKSTACLSNVKAMALGHNMYSADNNDRFSPSDGWMDLTEPYVRFDNAFHCPSHEAGKAYGYAMSESVGGKLATKIADPAEERLVFDSSLPGRSAVGGKETMPSPGRHVRRNNVGYVDGHARSLSP